MCGKTLGRGGIRGERSIKASDSWYSSKAIEVAYARKKEGEEGRVRRKKAERD